MKKIILMFCFAILGMSALTSCHSVSPDADEEAVIVKRSLGLLGMEVLNSKQCRLVSLGVGGQRVVITSRLFQSVMRLP